MVKRTVPVLEVQTREAGRQLTSTSNTDAEKLPIVGPAMPTYGEFWAGPVQARPQHRATSFELAATYPFTASVPEPGGPVLGLEVRSGGAPFSFDPWNWYERGLVSSPNLLVMGSLRRGKSFAIKRMVTLLSMWGRLAINTSDSKGEHGIVAEAIGGEVIKVGKFGSDVRVNPLDRSVRHTGIADQAHEETVRTQRLNVMGMLVEQLTGQTQLTLRQVALIEWALGEVIARTNDHPTIRDMYDLLIEADTQAGKVSGVAADEALALSDALRRLVTGDLAGMFDTHSTVQLSPECPYTVIDTENMARRGDLALAVTNTVTNAWVQGLIADKHSGRKYFLLMEEGWRNLGTVSALESHRLQLKLSGELGIVMCLIVHEGGDFDAVGPEGSKERDLAQTLLKGYANVMSFFQPQMVVNESVAQGMFTPEEGQMIGALGRGMFLLKTHSQSYVVDGNPTTTAWEREVFNTDRQMVSHD